MIITLKGADFSANNIGNISGTTTVNFTYTNYYCSSSNHANGFGTLMADERFRTSSVFAVKAGQKITIHAFATQNVAVLFETNSSGTPIAQLVAGEGSQASEKDYTYVATKDMYCRSSTNVGTMSVDKWTITLSNSGGNAGGNTGGNAGVINVNFTTYPGFYSSENHASGYGIKQTNDKFSYSSVFEVKAGQTVSVYSCINYNVCALLQTDASGKPIGNQALITEPKGDAAPYETKIREYTATEDMYCVACNNSSNGTTFLPNSQWTITLRG